MRETIPLQQGVIYGPVNSRRLGRSLGINLLPTRFKQCTFDCLYCQYGWTNRHNSQITEIDFPTAGRVLAAIETALKELSPPPAYLTFSGNGEPTLHPRFDEIAEGLTELRDRRAPHARTAILSNSGTVDDDRIRASLEKLDMKILKLDCGDEETFRRFNRPATGITLDRIVSGLQNMPNVVIQSLFAGGPAGNFTERNLNAWQEKILQISPVHVQLYSLDRGFPSRGIKPLQPAQLESITKRLASKHIDAAVYF